MTDRADAIAPTEGSFELPVTELLTGRGAIFGKSGSGKSNTVTVLLEELLARDLSFLVVDSDGEYYGLKEEYEVVRAGADEECDVRVAPEDADALAELALERDVPVVLDCSGYLDAGVVDSLVKSVLEALFHREKDLRKPFLVVLEEVHEYIPQSGGGDDLAETVVRVAKRGRKRGLGVLGVSQRPAAVEKDFITQCNWLVWHRLTWNNDVGVVRSHLGSEYADRVEGLDAGAAFVMCDWTETIESVSFRLKRTFDAGATPGFEEFSPPPLKPVPKGALDGFETGSRRAGTARTASALPTSPEPDADSTGTTGVDDDGAGDDDGAASGGEGDDASSSGAAAADDLPVVREDAYTARRPRAERRDDMVWETGLLVTYVIDGAVGRCRRATARAWSWLRSRARRVAASLRRAVAARWQNRSMGLAGLVGFLVTVLALVGVAVLGP